MARYPPASAALLLAAAAALVLAAGAAAGAAPESCRAAAKTPKQEAYAKMLADAEAIEGEIVALRRELHMKPATMYEEYEAQALVMETLGALGIEGTKTAITGVRADRGADAAERLVVLRADMDALPIQEMTDVPFKSTVPGVMHACGHDTHTAMLLGAAKLLKPFEERLKAEGKAVRFAFQPGEEGGAGGKRMIDEGLLEGAHAAFALHTKSTSPTGLIIGKEGGCRRAPPVPDTARIVGRDARRD